jgi:hypothetical protein
MPEAPIPFTNKQASGQEPLAGATVVAMNVVTDELGAVYRRPGILASPLATSAVIDANGISGLYKTLDGKIWAVGASGPPERPIYQVGPGGSVKLGGGAAGLGLRGAGRPTFAETEMLLVLAGGAEPEKVILATGNSARLGGAPPFSTHVLGNASRLLLNDNALDKTKVRFSDLALGTTSYAGHEVWSLGGVGTSGYFTAEGRPDPVVALAEDTNEVLVFGSATLQSFQPDPTVTYSPLATREVGCSAPYSVVKIDQDFFWLDHLRRFIGGGSRSYQPISDPIQRTLDAMVTASDCWGAYVAMDFLDVILWTFPTDGRVFVFQKGQGWGQWAGQANGNWAPLGITAVHMPADGTDVLVGTSAGKIGTLSLDASTDFGEPIRASVTTGYLDHGTSSLKHCASVKFALKRGTTSSSTGPQAFFRFKDRFEDPWSDSIPIDLGASGDRDIVVIFRSLGTYRSRQWQFEYVGAESLSLVSATEEFTVLAA